MALLINMTAPAFISDQRNSPEALEEHTGVPPEQVRGAARLFAAAPNGAIYYGLGVTEHSQGSRRRRCGRRCRSPWRDSPCP